MADTNTKTEQLIIAVVGVHNLLNSYLYDALILMSQDLENACYQMDENCCDYTSSLKFGFANQSLVFWKPPKTSGLRDTIKYPLSASDGVIVNLGGRILDINYLKNSQSYNLSPILKRFTDFIYEARLSVVFAIEDIEDSFERIDVYTEEGAIGWFTESKPVTTISVDDDIWQPDSPALRAIRDILEIPAGVPLLPYTYRRPVTLQNILTTLLAEIEERA